MRQKTMAARIRALQAMTVKDLRAAHIEVFGEESRSNNKAYLWKRIAWRIQANEEGDLSERARRRAAELANDADVRIRAPRGAFGDGSAPPPERTEVHPFDRVRDDRLPMPGTVLTRDYKGRAIRMMVLDDCFEYEGRPYRSLTAVAQEVTGSHWNGYHFFGLTGRRASGGPR